MSTPAERAHLRLRELLQDSTRTHRKPDQSDRRGINVAQLNRLLKARGGMRTGRKASLRRNPGNPTRRP